MGEDERDGQVDEGEPRVFGQEGEPLDRLELGGVHREGQVEASGRALAAAGDGQLGSLAVAPGQPPAGQRAPRDHGQSIALRNRQDLALDTAGQQGVRRLLGHDTFPASPLGDPLPFHDGGRLEGRRPDIADLSLVDEVAQSAEGVVEVSAGLGPVHLVEVDPVGPQAEQAVLDLADDPSAGVAPMVGVVAHGCVELRREHHLVPQAPGERLADDFLGLTL